MRNHRIQVIPHSRPFFDKNDIASIANVLKRKFVSSGTEAKQVAKKAHLLGKKWGIPTQSGTDAITASLATLKLKQNAKIAVPAYICTAVLDAIAISGGIPFPVDIEKESLAISLEKLNSTKGISATIGAHLFGIPAILNRIKNTDLIEDCAQTLCIKNSDGVLVGSSGRFSIFSFYATKLVSCGHGGMIAGNNEEDKKSILKLFNHDKQDEWFPHLHYLMSDLNASLALSQLNKIKYFIAQRRIIATRYMKALGIKNNNVNSVFSRFIVVSEKPSNAEILIKKFINKGIEAKKPVYKPLFKYLEYDAKKYPIAEWADKNIVSIPIWPGMKETQIQRIENFLQEHKNEMRCWPPA